MKFFQQLAAINKAQGHQLCAGIDLHMQAATWKILLQTHGAEELIFRCCAALVAGCGTRVKAFKLQSAFFEVHGSAGITALKRVCDLIHHRDGVVILDAKRGDISTTMAAYGQMAFDYFGADALTVLPYMGISTFEALEPWLDQRGIYAVWVSSNPDGVAWQSPVQSLILKDCIAWTERKQTVGSLGFVLGATKVEDLVAGDWELVRSQALLLPGFGAQGAKLTQRHRDLAIQSPASLFPVSRGLCDFEALIDKDLSVFEAKINKQTENRVGDLVSQFSL